MLQSRRRAGWSEGGQKRSLALDLLPAEPSRRPVENLACSVGFPESLDSDQHALSIPAKPGGHIARSVQPVLIRSDDTPQTGRHQTPRGP